jgi:hypothetical protein
MTWTLRCNQRRIWLSCLNLPWSSFKALQMWPSKPLKSSTRYIVAYCGLKRNDGTQRIVIKCLNRIYFHVIKILLYLSMKINTLFPICSDNTFSINYKLSFWIAFSLKSAIFRVAYIRIRGFSPNSRSAALRGPQCEPAQETHSSTPFNHNL